MTIPQNAEESSEELIPVEDIDSEVEDLDQDPDESEESGPSKEDTRFQDGQILRFVRVRFPGNSRSFPFLVGKRRIEYGQKVVAMSDRGMAVGYVNSFPYDVPFNKSMLPVRSINKIADQEDIQRDRDAYHQQKEAENICNKLIESHKLDMYLTHVEFTSFGKKAIFYFIAPSRVDFRDLVRELVGKLKTRIELRQISVRDRSASVGGIGPCGRELCCSSFLTKYGNVGIKMAKNQDLTLNFSKLNGVCGQLKCCLQYEDDVYRDKRSRLPREGEYITTHTGESGRVDRLHLLNEQFVMMTNRGVRKRYMVHLFKQSVSKEEANFPNEFESVSDETHKVIGLEEHQEKKTRAFEEEVKALKAPAKLYAEDVFEQLFGEKTLGLQMPEVLEPDTGHARKIISPDEEEEITYIPSEDEGLPDDDDSLVFEGASERIESAPSRDQRPRGGRGRNRDRRPQHHNARGQGGSQGGQQGSKRPPR